MKEGSPVRVQNAPGTALNQCRQCGTNWCYTFTKTGWLLVKGPRLCTPQGTMSDTFKCLIQVQMWTGWANSQAPPSILQRVYSWSSLPRPRQNQPHSFYWSRGLTVSRTLAMLKECVSLESLTISRDLCCSERISSIPNGPLPPLKRPLNHFKICITQINQSYVKSFRRELQKWRHERGTFGLKENLCFNFYNG